MAPAALCSIDVNGGRLNLPGRYRVKGPRYAYKSYVVA
jgi:hypothetical protein